MTYGCHARLIKLALEIMDAWLGLPQHTYKATFYRFANELPPDEVLEAVEIAQAKIPLGGRECLQVFLRRVPRQD